MHDIRQIRLAAGLNVTSIVQDLNVPSLAPRRQILLGEQFEGSGNCLGLHVIQHDSAGFRQVWLLNRDPASSGGICGTLGRYPRVAVSPDGAIVLASPPLDIDAHGRYEHHVYIWNGKTYVLKQ